MFQMLETSYVWSPVYIPMKVETDTNSGQVKNDEDGKARTKEPVLPLMNFSLVIARKWFWKCSG